MLPPKNKREAKRLPYGHDSDLQQLLALRDPSQRHADTEGVILERSEESGVACSRMTTQGEHDDNQYQVVGRGLAPAANTNGSGNHSPYQHDFIQSLSLRERWHELASDGEGLKIMTYHYALSVSRALDSSPKGRAFC